LADERRHFQLTPDEFRLLNPNTRTCPVFRSQHDAELTKKLYRAAPVLIEEGRPEPSGKELRDKNPWGVSFQRMFDMSTDSGLFWDEAASPAEPPRLPLYEAKMIHQFDHRWATYIDAPDKPDGLDTEDCTLAQKADPTFTVRPRYWVEERQVLARIARVPSRVASAWLATHAAGAHTPLEPEKSLEVAVAGWVAGELFRRAAGKPDATGGWPDKILGQAYQAAINEFERRFEDLAMTLRGIGIDGKKALSEFIRWAKLDADLSLGDNEFADIDEWRQRWHPSSSDSTRVQVLLNTIDAWMEARSPRWLIGWRDICRSTDYRTLIASVIPRAGVGDKFLLMSSTASVARVAALLGCLNSLTCDYIARQKVGGTALKYFTMKQLAVLPPDRYSEADLSFIVPRVLELTYTADDLRPWAEDLGYTGEPFPWNPDRRARLRAELDAYYAKLYGLTRDELRFILDPADVLGQDYPSETFRVMKTNERREFKKFRTQELVLDAWDRLETGELVDRVTPSHDVGLVYGDHGVIRNDAEAELAGVVSALVAVYQDGLSIADIQAIVAHATTASYAELHLDAKDALRLVTLTKDAGALTSSSALQLIPSFVHRLETCGAVRRVRKGDAFVYGPGVSPLPPDVRSRPEHTELAKLMLELDGRRRLAKHESSDSGSVPQRGRSVG
jgi:hypothetical protein